MLSTYPFARMGKYKVIHRRIRFKSKINILNRKWVTIFKALGNYNRLKIIGILHTGNLMNVTGISEKIGISIKSTSKNLIILQNLDILESEGRDNHVWYRLNRNLPKAIKRALSLFI